MTTTTTKHFYKVTWAQRDDSTVRKKASSETVINKERAALMTLEEFSKIKQSASTLKMLWRIN